MTGSPDAGTADRRHCAAVIGAGKVGCALARFLRAQRHEVRVLVDPFAGASLLPADLRPLLAPSLDAIPPEADLLLIAVPDGAIPSVAAALAVLPAPPRSRLVAHCSGMRTSDDLLPLAGACPAGSMHPVQSFTSRDADPDMLRGIGCGIEGDDGFAAAAARLARGLGWHPVRVRKDRKALYHAACALAGNLSLALAEDARALLLASLTSEPEPAGPGRGPSPFFAPMLRAVLERAERLPFAEALSGPLARGDGAALEAHLEALRDFAPDVLPLYEALLARCRELLKRS